MPLIDSKNGILDYEFDGESLVQVMERVSLLEQDRLDARGALFAAVTVVRDGRQDKVTAIEAFMDSLTAAAAQKDAHAREILDKLSEHEQRKRARAERALAHRRSPIRAQQRAMKPIRAIGNNIGSMIAIRMLPCVLRAFEAVHGPIELSASLVPCYLDPGPAIDTLLRNRRRARRKQVKDGYKVGRGRPPVPTRFTSEQNPRRKSKAFDLWDSLDKSRKRTVTVTSSNGKKSKVTRNAAAYAALCREAIRGKRKPRATLLKVIIGLDENAVLSPPPLARRRRGEPPELSAKVQMAIKVTEVLFAPIIKRDLVDLFSRRYGEVPEFITRYEHHLPSIKDIEGWAECRAELAERRKASEQRIDETAAQEATLPTPIVPTRPRTRSGHVNPLPHRVEATAAAARSSLPRADKPVVSKTRLAGNPKANR